jgi:PilZ domain
MAILRRLHLSRRRQDFSWEFKERRLAPRLPLRLPVRLRLGPEVYDGHSSDVAAGGMAVQVIEQPPAHQAAERKLYSDDRGALELFLGDSQIAVRVRIARVQRNHGQAYVGLIIDDPREAERLVKSLADHGYGLSA